MAKMLAKILNLKSLKHSWKLKEITQERAQYYLGVIIE